MSAFILTNYSVLFPPPAPLSPAWWAPAQILGPGTSIKFPFVDWSSKKQMDSEVLLVGVEVGGVCVCMCECGSVCVISFDTSQ